MQSGQRFLGCRGSAASPAEKQAWCCSCAHLVGYSGAMETVGQCSRARRMVGVSVSVHHVGELLALGAGAFRNVIDEVKMHVEGKGLLAHGVGHEVGAAALGVERTALPAVCQQLRGGLVLSVVVMGSSCSVVYRLI